MDIIVRNEQTCPCGNKFTGMPVHCNRCYREAADAFWAFINGKISFPGFMRKLRKRDNAPDRGAQEDR